MSKFLKIFLLTISAVSISSFVFFSLKPKENSGFDEKEISIQQTTIGGSESKMHEDWAGFSFEYPDSLTVEEVEVDDKTIYSSLELTAFDGKKIMVKVADTRFKTLDDWQKSFDNNNVAMKVKDIYWADILGKQLQYGAPKKLLTTAVDQNIVYQIESIADDGGFWNQTHQLILNSFAFDQSAIIQDKSTEASESTESGDIVLIEEIIE